MRTSTALPSGTRTEANLILRGQNGYALAAVVVITGVLLIVGATTVQLVQNQLRTNAYHVGHEKAFYVAEAGLQRAIAQLDQDRATASASTTYTYSTTETSGEGTYTISIAQDPLFSTTSGRKRIRSIGRVGEEEASVVSNVVVPDTLPGAICSSQSDCRILTLIPATTSLFNGLIHAGRDAIFQIAGGAAINGSGTVRAGDNLVSNALVALLSTLDASGYSTNGWANAGLHSHALLLEAGVHFGNVGNSHGEIQAITARAHPIPDYERLARDPRTRLINDDNAPPFGTWDAATDTWTYNSPVAFPTNPEIMYYVDGNVNFNTVQLAANARATIIARGWISILTVGLVTSPLGVGDTVAVGPASAGASTTVTVGSGSGQHLELIAEDKLSVGQAVVSTSPTITFDTETTSLLNAALGIGLAAASIGNTTTNVYAYSEKDTVWVKMATVAALSEARVSLTGYGEAALAYGAAVASAVQSPF